MSEGEERASGDEHEAQRLAAIQRERQEQEQVARDQASDPDEQQAHDRRAEKAGYLSDKLAEQARSQDE